MSQNNPTIFFSHSSKDSPQLGRLRELFRKKTGGSIEVFLSSDGQSIPFGRNWIHRVETALDDAKVMVVFVSPNSLASHWLFFEAGYAYSRKIEVVPVGFAGVDLSQIPPPLGLLQGFNITSEEGLDNLIAIVNRTFGHAHEENFSKEDYEAIHLSESIPFSRTFGNQVTQIQELSLLLNDKVDSSHSNKDCLQALRDLFTKEGIEFHPNPGGLSVHGLDVTEFGPANMLFSLYPAVADRTLPILEKILRRIRKGGVRGAKLRVTTSSAEQSYDLAWPTITGTLLGTDVKFPTGGKGCLGDLEFEIRSTGHVNITVLGEQFPLEQIRELISLLFDRRLLLNR